MGKPVRCSKCVIIKHPRKGHPSHREACAGEVGLCLGVRERVLEMTTHWL